MNTAHNIIVKLLTKLNKYGFSFTGRLIGVDEIEMFFESLK
jgi:hypothetical protein